MRKNAAVAGWPMPKKSPAKNSQSSNRNIAVQYPLDSKGLKIPGNFVGLFYGSVAAVQSNSSPMTALAWKADTNAGRMSALANTRRSEARETPNLNDRSRPLAVIPNRQRQRACRRATTARKLQRRNHKTPVVDPACLIARRRPGWDRVQLACKDLEHNSRLLPG